MLKKNFSSLCVRLLAVLFVFLWCGFAYASPVSVAVARLVADNFRENYNQPSAEPQLLDTKSLGIGNLYWFDYGDGFVIVSSDDCVQPILAYAFSGRCDTNMSPATRSWLRVYDETIARCAEQDFVPSAATQTRWKQLRQGKAKFAKSGHTVDALIHTRWNQGYFYNQYCPYDDSAGRNAMAGCVATAMGQIMKYWNYPVSGLGSHSYISAKGGLQTADFAGTVYDWDNMPSYLNYESSPAEVDAVAELLYHCGVAVDMDYAVDGSGAFGTDYDNGSLPCIRHAMPRYFDYKSSARSVYMSNYSASEWIGIMKAELLAGRPVAYCGSDDEGGHAFVCDGYDADDRLHFNWGWSGYNDGYFSLYVDADDETLFPIGQNAVIGIEPNDHFRIDTARHTFAKEGGSFVVAVTSASDNGQSWHADHVPDWLTLSVAQGEGYGVHTKVALTSAINNTGEARSDTLRFVQGERTLQLYVFQLACSAEEQVALTVQMQDVCAESWNYAYLEFRDQSGAEYGRAFMISGEADATAVIDVCPSLVELVWHRGVWDEECSFEVACANGTVLYGHEADTEFDEEVLSQINDPANICVDCDEVRQTPWHEDFEYGLGCWHIHDVDGAGDSWKMAVAQRQSQMQGRCIKSVSVGQSTDHWIESPMIQLPSTAPITLSWQSYAVGNQRYRVYVSVDGLISDEALLFEVSSTEDPEQNAISLYAYAGAIVSVYFVHEASDEGSLQLDNISIASTRTPYFEVVAVGNMAAAGEVRGGGTYVGGSMATLTATCNHGYHFLGWQDGDTACQRVLCVAHDLSFTALFEADDYMVVAEPDDPQMGEVEGSGSYPYEAEATIVAQAKHGYHFVQWSDGNTDNPRVLTVTDDIALSALFAPNEYRVALASSDDVMGIVNGEGTYLYGEEACFEAVANNGYRFVQWSDGQTDNPYCVAISGDMTLTAQFIAIDNLSAIARATSDNVAIFVHGKAMQVSNAAGRSLSVCDLMGRIVYCGVPVRDAFQIALPHSGIYLVTIDRRFHSRQMAY